MTFLLFCSRCATLPPALQSSAPAQLQQVLVSEYDAGAGIGWHRDKFVFGDVVGISLLRGPSRTEWEHSIPPVEELRYSITFRNLRET